MKIHEYDQMKHRELDLQFIKKITEAQIDWTRVYKDFGMELAKMSPVAIQEMKHSPKVSMAAAKYYKPSSTEADNPKMLTRTITL